MAKLVDILAREMKEWPEGAGDAITQSVVDTMIYSDDANERGHIGIYLSKRHSEPADYPRVTRAKWDRARKADGERSMKRDKVIELARKSGVGPSHPALTMHEADIQAVEQLVALVEKETLDRAAKVCHDKAMKMELEAQSAESEDDEDTAMSNRASAWLLHVAGCEIAKLKDNHGQD